MRTIINPDNIGSQELSPYQVHSRREITALLRSLIQQNQLLSLLIDGGPDAVVTTILDIDEDSNKVVIDCAPTPHLNVRIIESDNISFETVLDHIRILFFASHAEECVHANLPALRIDLPTSLIRLQRREFYRVLTPVSMPVRCMIQIPHEEDGTTESVTVTLQNVSGGGIGIVDDKKQLDNTIGRIYKDCRINLPGNTVVVTSLQIRNSQDVTLANGKVIRRIGCLFIELPKPMMAAIQRYITKLEREQNARSNGL